ARRRRDFRLHVVVVVGVVVAVATTAAPAPSATLAVCAVALLLFAVRLTIGFGRRLNAILAVFFTADGNLRALSGNRRCLSLRCLRAILAVASASATASAALAAMTLAVFVLP